jgi:hypothetical protein
MDITTEINAGVKHYDQSLLNAIIYRFQRDLSEDFGSETILAATGLSSFYIHVGSLCECGATIDEAAEKMRRNIRTPAARVAELRHRADQLREEADRLAAEGLPGAAIPTPEEVFGVSSVQSAASFAHLPAPDDAAQKGRQ